MKDVNMKEEFESNDNSELPAVIGALLDSLDDKNQDVKQSVIESIERLSMKNPETVIHATIYFWEMHKKISTEHTASLLNIMSNICKHSATSLNTNIATSLAEIAANELIGESENEAAELLTELCKKYCMQAMGELLSKLKPGIIPNAAIVFTIGKLAATNPYGMLSFIKVILTIILPMLNQIREEVLKQAVCLMISKFCEAINDYMMNEELLVPEINKHSFEEEICSACDFLMHNWLKTSRDFKSTEAILNALASIISLLSEQQNNERIIKLIPICLNLSKKFNIRLASVKVLAVLLNCIKTESDKEAIRPSIEYIHQTLFEYVSISPFDETTRNTLLTHFEVLQCSKSLVTLYPEEGLDRTLQQLKSPSANQRARALVVLKYLINTLPSEDDGTLQRIALSLQESLGEDNSLQMVSAIAALAARPTFPLLPSQRAKFIRYMVLHCETKNDNMKECSTALHLLATTVDGVESWLWPCLIEALLDPSCVASVTSVLRSLTPLAIKIINNENSSIDERDFPGTKVLGRCLELLSDPANRFAVMTFLRTVAPLVGHRIKPYWDKKLFELSQICLQNEQTNSQKNSKEEKDSMLRDLIWEKKVVEWLEESMKLEGESWGSKIAEELVSKANVPNVALLLACTCNNNAHITLLVELARSHGTTKEFARAVGICAKRHLNIVLKLMEEFCAAEDARKVRVRLLGLMKAATTAEAAKAGLLQSYAEIAQRGDPQKLFPAFEKHVLPWNIKQLNECKELSIKEAGLSVLEQVGNAVHPTKFPEFKGLRIKTTALASLLGILQSSTGYRPLQLYPAVLKAINSLIRIPPMLNNEEREIFLSAILDKTIGASSEIDRHLNSEIMQQVMDELGAISSEIVSDSANALAELVDILLPWVQSKSNIERKMTLLVLHTVLQSYYNSLKYTYPGGKLDAGQLIGRIFCWCADDDCELRPLVIDCLLLSLDIAARHRHKLPESASIENIQKIKKEMTEDLALTYGTIKNLADAVSNKIPSGEIVGFAEGLIEGLLFYGDTSLAAGVGLTRHFEMRGSEISRTDVCLVDSIIVQMRQIENRSCRFVAITAIVSLMKYHPEEVNEHLLSQPLPLDPGTRLCWKEIGNDEQLGNRALELLLVKLEFGNLFSEVTTHSGKNNTVSLPSLAAIMGLKYLLESPNMEHFVELHLSELLSVLLKYLSGWLYVEAPMSLINTKYGYVPNRAAQKINPYAEVYSVITNILMIIQPNVAHSLVAEAATCCETQTEENVISIVETLVKCISKKNENMLTMAQKLSKLVTSTIAIQRAIVATFYTELIDTVNCGVIWLETMINTLYECKTDSSSLVRKHAIIGLARICHLDQKLFDEYFDNCMDAFLDGLEETAGGEGGTEVVVESLRSLSMLLQFQYKKPVSPRVVLALKPFIEKEYWEMKLYAIEALGAVAANWHRSIALPTDDLIDHLLGCLPSLIIRLEDTNRTIVMASQITLCNITDFLRNEKLAHVMFSHLGPEVKFDFETSAKVLINCLKEEFPQRAEELRNAVVRGYSKSENDNIRATSALLLGLFSSPRPEDIQRLLQLLRDRKSVVRIRASQALSFCYTS